MRREDLDRLAAALPQRALRYDEALQAVLPADLAQPLAAKGLETLEDLYECAATQGANWFRVFEGIDAQRAQLLMLWLAKFGEAIGEITARFFFRGKPRPASLARSRPKVRQPHSWQHKVE